MGVVIEICVKYPGGRTRITVTDIIYISYNISHYPRHHSGYAVS
jgi:hypothetical protein